MKFIKRVALIAIAVMVILSAVACSSSKNATDPSYPEAQTGGSTGSDSGSYAPGMGTAPDKDQDEGGSKGTSIEDISGHKVIQNVRISIETRNFDQDRQYILERAAEKGGYVASSSLEGRVPTTYNDTGRTLSMTIRVPAENLEAFVNDAQGVATLLSINKDSSDITSSYIDTESRIRVLNIQLDKLETLLKQATTVTDMITIENEMARVRVELEQLTTQIKQWDDLVDFASVSMYLRELPPVSGTADEDSAWTRMREGFLRTFSGVGVFFEEFAIFLVSALPALIIIAAAAVALVFIIKSAQKRKRAKRAKLAAQQTNSDEAK